MALLSQAKKSECGTAQRNSCIADDNVLNKQYTEPPPLKKLYAFKIWYRQTNKQTDRQKGWA